MSFQTNLGSRRLPETLITLDELNGAILIFAVFPFSHPKTPVYFSCFGECCSSVLLWSSRNFPSAWGWVDCDRMLFFYWTYPLIFQVSLSQKRKALKSNENIFPLKAFLSWRPLNICLCAWTLNIPGAPQIEPSSLSGRTRGETFLQHSRVYSSGIILLVWYIPWVDFLI